VRRLDTWYKQNASLAPEAFWWEFAAASGSTLGSFALFGLASQTSADEAGVARLVSAYFPYVCGLHILLDYFIDQEEDRQNCDLNLVSYYHTPFERRVRLASFVENSRLLASVLPDPEFHTTVVLGLLAFYLSDPKAGEDLIDESRGLVRMGGRTAGFMTYLCRLLRGRNRI